MAPAERAILKPRHGRPMPHVTTRDLYSSFLSLFTLSSLSYYPYAILFFHPYALIIIIIILEEMLPSTSYIL